MTMYECYYISLCDNVLLSGSAESHVAHNKK